MESLPWLEKGKLGKQELWAGRQELSALTVGFNICKPTAPATKPEACRKSHTHRHGTTGELVYWFLTPTQTRTREKEKQLLNVLKGTAKPNAPTFR